MSRKRKAMVVFRVESTDGKLGLWRDADGTWNPKFHLLRDGKCKDMPMDDSLLYGKEGKRWFASAPSKELLREWFSLDDLRDLQKHGFGIYEFEVSQWCHVSKAEIIFPRDAVVSRRQIGIGDIYPEGSLIQWPRAKYWTDAWNPIVGCRPCSPACENCYAKAWAERFKQAFEPHESGAKTPPRRGVVFCGNMTDLWGEWNIVHENGGYYAKACDFIAETLGFNPKNPYKDKATYLWLTKRVACMAEWVSEGGWETWRCLDDADCMDFKDCDMSNQYFGFTAENQEWYDRRQMDSMALEPWANMWYSLEPLLGPIELGAGLVRSNLRWVVVGCESGPRRRPCKVEWVETIVHQCVCAGVPVFVKQLDLGGRCVTDITRFPEHLRIRQVPWA